jgi:hypothetical protein
MINKAQLKKGGPKKGPKGYCILGAVTLDPSGSSVVIVTPKAEGQVRRQITLVGK